MPLPKREKQQASEPGKTPNSQSDFCLRGDSIQLEGVAAHLLDEPGVVRFGENPWKDVREQSCNVTSVLLCISQSLPFMVPRKVAQAA